MILEELLVKVGVQTDTKELSKLELSLKNLPAIAGTVGAVAAASIAGLSAFVSMSLNALDSIHQLSNETGVAADKIYLLGKVAELNGSSVEAAQASYKGLSKAIGEAANGVGLGAKAFETFGISAKNADGSVRDAADVLEDIRAKMQGLSDQQQIAMLAKLGIDASMIQTLRLTNEEMADALSNAEALSLGVGTQENAATAAAFQDSLAEVAQIGKGIAEYFSLKLAPALMRIIGLFRDWFIANNQLIKNGLNFFAGILGAVIDIVGALARVLDTIIDGTVGWENALYGLVAVFAIVKKAMIMAFVTNPIAWVVAAIVGLVLLIEDFITYMQGGDSYFGDFWDAVAQVVNKVIGLFERLLAWIKVHWQRFKGLFNLDWFKSLLGRVWDFITAPFRRAFNRVKSLWASFKNEIDVNALKTAFFKVIGSITTPFTKAFGAVKKKWESFKAELGVESIGDLFNKVIDFITKPFEDAWNSIKTDWEEFSSEGFSFESLSKAFSSVIDVITAPFKSAFDWVEKQYNKYIQPIIDKISGIKLPSWLGGGNKQSVEQHIQNGGQAVRRPDGSLAIPIADVAKAGAVTNTTNNNTDVKNYTTVNMNLSTTNTTEGDARMMVNSAATAVRNAQSPQVI